MEYRHRKENMETIFCGSDYLDGIVGALMPLIATGWQEAFVVFYLWICSGFGFCMPSRDGRGYMPMFPVGYGCQLRELGVSFYSASLQVTGKRSRSRPPAPSSLKAGVPLLWLRRE